MRYIILDGNEQISGFALIKKLFAEFFFHFTQIKNLQNKYINIILYQNQE